MTRRTTNHPSDPEIGAFAKEFEVGQAIPCAQPVIPMILTKPRGFRRAAVMTICCRCHRVYWRVSGQRCSNCTVRRVDKPYTASFREGGRWVRVNLLEPVKTP